MLRFSEKVFDSYVSGTQPVYSDTRFADLLGSVDHLNITGNSENASGSPVLTIQVEHSADGARWFNRNASPELSGVTLSSGVGFLSAVSDGSAVDRPTLPLARLRIALSGGSTGLRIWIAGRDPAR